MLTALGPIETTMGRHHHPPIGEIGNKGDRLDACGGAADRRLIPEDRTAKCARAVYEPCRLGVDWRPARAAEALSFYNLLDWSRLVSRAPSRS